MPDKPKASGDVAWVKTVPVGDAQGELARAYATVADDAGAVENLYLAMSLLPATIAPADAHYRALLHHPDAPLAPWLAELVVTWVAILCDCEYARVCHGANYRRHRSDDAESTQLLAALEAGSWRETVTDRRLYAALVYTEKLTLRPAQMNAQDVDRLREVGFDDREISHLVQLGASFAYWARLINGLGIRL